VFHSITIANGARIQAITATATPKEEACGGHHRGHQQRLPAIRVRIDRI
jgi:hypothetical protein